VKQHLYHPTQLSSYLIIVNVFGEKTPEEGVSRKAQGLNEEEGNIKSRRRKIIVEKEIKVLGRKLELS